MRKTFYIALASISAIMATTLAYIHTTRAQGYMNSIILSSDELKEINPAEFDEVRIKFIHTWGNAYRSRRIIMLGSGEYAISDWQDAAQLKQDVLAGEIERSYFEPSELEMVLRDNVEFNIYFRGRINPEMIKQILNITASAVDGNYALSKGGSEFWSDHMYCAVTQGEKGIIMIEEVNEDYHDLVKLEALFEIEQLIETAVSESESYEIGAMEYAEFSEQYTPDTSKIYTAQWKLREAKRN